jgi:hypothetical protein
VEQRGWHVWDETPRDEERDAAPTKPDAAPPKPLPREAKQPVAEPQRIVSNVSSDSYGDSWKDKLEEVVSAPTQEQRLSPIPTAESEALAEDIVKKAASVELPRDYNFVRPIADLLSSNPSAVKTRPVERPTRVPVERSTSVPAETPARVPTEGSARIPTERSTRVPTEPPARVPTEGSARIPVERSTRVPTETPEHIPTEAPTRPRKPTQHQVVWFDIPVRDIDRALRFYSAVLGKTLKKEQAGFGAAVVLLPHDEGSIGGSLVQSMDAKPSDSGPLLYLNTHDRLEEALRAVERHGGKVVSEVQSIAPFGYRAIVLDSEGNRIALHSM